jgi:4-diphosphocytidyl-2-C-methyl-D-erythritol kinase
MLEKASFCKVNLLLNVLGKRVDGYHELETVLHPIDVCDHLSIARGGSGIALRCSDPRLPVNSQNLVFRAAALFLSSAGLPPSEGIRIHLHKEIPVAAGLGGGSGDAAVTLLALNELFGHPLERAKLEELAALLGSETRPGYRTRRKDPASGVFPGFARRLFRSGPSRLWCLDALGV